MLDNDQFDFINHHEVGRAHEKELLIREYALAAAKNPAGSLTFALMDPETYEGFYSRQPERVLGGFKTITVRLHPAARGFIRVLLAEKQIREQMNA